MQKIIVKAGQRPTEAQLREVAGAEKYPIQFDAECPASNEKALSEFAEKARELRREKRRVKPAVTIRLDPDCLAAYKSLGRGYTGVMADVLAYAAENPKLLERFCLPFK